jgi:hypothetical protein
MGTNAGAGKARECHSASWIRETDGGEARGILRFIGSGLEVHSPAAAAFSLRPSRPFEQKGRLTRVFTKFPDGFVLVQMQCCRYGEVTVLAPVTKDAGNSSVRIVRESSALAV